MEVALHYSDIFFELRNPKAICFGISEVVVFFFFFPSDIEHE